MESLERINQQTKKSYNRAAQKYYDLFYDELDKKPFDKEFIDSYLNYFNTDSIICDAGCGPCGHVENYVFQKGFNIIGTDISDKCIEIAQKHFPKIKFEPGDFSKLKYSNDYYDGLISYYSIIDTPKIYMNKILGEFNRVLKKNGYLLLAVKEGNEEGCRNELLGIKTKIYFSLFTEEEIKTFLEANGFEIIKIQKRNPYEDEIEINRIFSISKKK
ncbi:MAG: methyltransferase domain-containing protein [Ignavibacteriaceae bacterium]